MRRAGLTLLVCGLLAGIFFLATDPRSAGVWADHLGWSSNTVDAATDATPGTFIGIAGSLLVLLTGLWLMLRRAI